MLLPASQVSRFQANTPKAMQDARGMERSANKRNTILVSQVGRDPDYVIYLYNILAGYRHTPIDQPPVFRNFKIPFCAKGEPFAFTTLPPVVKNPIERQGAEEGTVEISYMVRDGREAANSLVNPDQHPSNPFEAQFRDVEKFGNGDQIGNNLNVKGVWWSLTAPYLDEDENPRPGPGDTTQTLEKLHEEGKLYKNPKLDEEIAMMRKRVDATMQRLVTEGDRYNAAGQLTEISGEMHFAMDYFNLEAPWHRSHEHRVSCPNCSEPIKAGIKYHKNSLNILCVIDWQGAYEAGAVKKEDVPESKRWWEETVEPKKAAKKKVAS